MTIKSRPTMKPRAGQAYGLPHLLFDDILFCLLHSCILRKDGQTSSGGERLLFGE